jgi:hypothetical protein
MVMEFLDGADLATWLQRGPLPFEQAVDFVLQASVAVADAHGLGIVHRDLKPANLFCVRRSDGHLLVKVLDFGISKMTETERGVAMTGTASVIGSPLYMSPEQMQTPKEVDGQTDIWALGVILYELTTGEVPFGGTTFAEVAIKAATQQPPPMTTWRPDVSPGLQAVVLKCLAKAKTDRYRDVAELAMALAPFAPAHARGSIERISRIVHGAGAGGIDAASRIETTGAASNPTPPSPVASTAHAIGHTAPGVTRSGGGAKTFAGIAAVVLVSVGATIAVTRTGSKLAADPAIHVAPGTPSTAAAALVPPPAPSSTAETLAPTAAPVDPAPAAPSAAPTASSRPPSTPPAGKKGGKPPPAPPSAATARPEGPPPDSDPLSRLRFKQ